MYPIIVLEGPDGSGKTTLGEYLAQKWNAHYMHLTYRFKDRMFTYHTAALERAIKIAQHKPVIIDRWWPSINIYDDEFRPERRDPYAHRFLDRAGLAQGVIYVVCLPSDKSQLLADFEVRKAAGGEMYDRVGGILNKYEEWYATQYKRVDMVQYDRFTTGQDMAWFADYLKHRYHQINMRIPPWFQNTRQVAGQTINPKLMIVGEQSNPKGRHEVWPFYEQGYSSLWLTITLEQAGIPESDIVWANAYDEAGWSHSQMINRLYKETVPERVIALGGKAETVCMIAGVKVERLPHPAYVKRFQNGDRTEYLRVLKGEHHEYPSDD